MDGGLFPESFWPLALAHFLALLSPGPDFILIVSHGVRYAWRGGVFICAGVAMGNAAYIALAIAGWTGVDGNAAAFRLLQAAGAAYLAWMGLRLLRAARHPLPEPDAAAARLSPRAQFGIGIGSALLNPKNMVFYLLIMAVLIDAGATLRQRLAAGTWMCLMVLLWDLFLAATVSRAGVRRFLWRFLPKIETACGAALLFFAASLCVMAFLGK